MSDLVGPPLARATTANVSQLLTREAAERPEQDACQTEQVEAMRGHFRSS